MLEFVGLSTLGRVIGALSAHVLKSGSEKQVVFEFCTQTKTRLEKIADAVDGNKGGLDRLSGDLRTWAAVGVDGLREAVKPEIVEELQTALDNVATEISSEKFLSKSASERKALRAQLDQTCGQFEGLMDALALQKSETLTSRWVGPASKWGIGVVGGLATTAATAAAADVTENVPFVGPIVATWLRGKSNAKTEGQNDSEGSEEA